MPEPVRPRPSSSQPAERVEVLTSANRSSHSAVNAVNLAALLLAALTLLMFVVFFALPADDAYIVGRYVRQLYSGNGLVFNPGERINALTSPLHTLVIAVIHPLSRVPVDVYRIAAATLTAWTLIAIARRAYAAKPDAMLFLALTLASPFVCFWGIGGLETPLLLCACSCLTWLALSATPEGGPARALRIIGLATAAVLIRYDSILYVAPVAVLFLSWFRTDARVIAATIVCTVLALGWVAFTYVYYGDVLPTSFYVKLAGPTEGPAEVVRGVGYVLSFAVLTLVLPAALPRLWKRTESRPHAQITTMLALGVAAEAVYGVFAGDKHMMYAYRLFVPYLPSLVLLLSNARASREPASPGRPTRSAWVFLCLGYQTLMGIFLYYFSENPNLSLVFRKQRAGDELYEFSTLGARHTKSFLGAVRASATEIGVHWNKLPDRESRPMRIAVLTGGTLPYYLPEAYTLETLVSYRHHCEANLVSFADYIQFIQDADAPSSIVQHYGSEAAAWTLVSKHEMTVQGLQDKPFRLRVDIWYQKRPAPVTLPSGINEPCREPQLGS